VQHLTPISDITFKALFDHATIGILVVDDRGIINLANNSALAIFGYKIDELEGQPIGILVPRRFDHIHEKHRSSYMKHPENRAMGAGRDLYGVRKSGEEFPAELSLSSYEKEAKKFVIVFVVDITVRKNFDRELLRQKEETAQYATELHKLNEHLEQKVIDRTAMLRETLSQLELSKEELSQALEKEKELGDLKSRFVSMASHEFRTPLSTIMSSASLIGKYTTTEQQENRDKHVQRIKEQIKHLSDMLEDLLSLGKLEEGVVKVHPEVFDIQQWFGEMDTEIRPLLKKGQQIKWNHTGPDRVHSDRKLLRFVLLNLFSNAIKFSDEESEIKIDSILHDSKWYLTVTDAGLGIPAQDIERLFERFHRATNVSNIQGTGLGLHIVKRYVDLLAGDISVKSELQKGTSICMVIPDAQ
jgi:PAS domain S-box-containing protein